MRRVSFTFWAFMLSTTLLMYETNTELTTSTPEVLNTDTSTFKDSGSLDDLENKTDSTVAAKPETHTEVIPETTKGSTVGEPVSSTTTTSRTDVHRDDKLFYSNKAVRRKSARYQPNKLTRTTECCSDTDCFQVDPPWIPDPDPMIDNPDPMLPCPNPSGPCNSSPTSNRNIVIPLIIGGDSTTIEEHPHQVSVRPRKHHRHSCGGSILNQKTILTAAHCLQKLKGNECSSVIIKVGATNYREGEKYKVVKCIIHPEYNTTYKRDNDVAILKLATPLTYSPQVQPIQLQPAGTPVPAGTRAVVTGWGRTVQDVPARNHKLLQAHLVVVSNEECQRVYTWLTITTSMLCAEAPGRGACQGDSGGPLVADGRLIGVLSFGKGCARPHFPSVYANVSTLYDFVSEYM